MATQKMNAAQQKWWNDYSKAVQSGKNKYDSGSVNYYNSLAKRYGQKQAVIGSSALQQMSIKALQGDKNAQAYLKAMHYNPATGANLWKNYNTKDLANQSWELRHRYMIDNPMAQYTKDWELAQYNKFNGYITNNKQMTDDEIKKYNNYLNKWNLDDMNDPLVQQKTLLENNKNAQLKAQDVALNQGLKTMSGNNFQAYQQAQQDMANRGLGTSGTAQDAYTRLTMGANQAYQQAYTQTAQNKANISTEFGQSMNNVNMAIAQQQQAKMQAELEAKQATAELQSKQDQYLTQQSGMVYVNGKVMKDSKGNPIRTLDWYKMTETQRHNVATENNAATSNAIKAQGNQMDYNLGMTKIQSDMQKSQASMKLAYDKLNLSYAKYESDLNKTREQLTIAARNASTSEQRAMITGINNQINALQKQIKAQKDGKATAKQKEQLKKLMGQMDSVLGK